MWHPPAQILAQSNIWAITGNYGSGKTELSLNIALNWAKEGPCALVDLDIVNPYFRSAEQEEMLAAAGVRVLKPTFALTAVDIPALPAEIVTIFERGERVVLDVGGDDTGAAALGRYKPQLDRANAAMLFVINARRPLTADAGSTVDLLERICARSRRQVFALCNNTNLGPESTVQDVSFGAAIAQQVAQRCGIDRAFHSAAEHIAQQLPPALRAATLPITPYMRPEWM